MGFSQHTRLLSYTALSQQDVDDGCSFPCDKPNQSSCDIVNGTVVVHGVMATKDCKREESDPCALIHRFSVHYDSGSYSKPSEGLYPVDSTNMCIHCKPIKSHVLSFPSLRLY